MVITKHQLRSIEKATPVENPHGWEYRESDDQEIGVISGNITSSGIDDVGDEIPLGEISKARRQLMFNYRENPNMFDNDHDEVPSNERVLTQIYDATIIKAGKVIELLKAEFFLLSESDRILARAGQFRGLSIQATADIEVL